MLAGELQTPAATFEYYDLPETLADSLSMSAGAHLTAFEDSNVYQTGNDRLDMRAGQFDVAYDYMLVLAPNQTEQLAMLADDFDVAHVDVFVWAPNQTEQLAMLAGDFTAEGSAV